MKRDLFAKITKVDAMRREVHGILAEERLDKDKEIFDYDASKPFFQKWNADYAARTKGKSVGNLRSMHSHISAGKFINMQYNDTAKMITVIARVVDDKEWEKVQEGVYTGFSIGARVVSRDGQKYTADPYEGSLVDNPAMYGALFTAVKADGTIRKMKFKGSQENTMKTAKPVTAEVLEKRFSEFMGDVEEVLDERLEGFIERVESAVSKGRKASYKDDEMEEADGEEVEDADGEEVEDADGEEVEETDAGGKGSSEGKKPKPVGGRSSGKPVKQPSGVGGANGGMGSRGSADQRQPTKPPRKAFNGDEGSITKRYIEKMEERQERLEKMVEDLVEVVNHLAGQPVTPTGKAVALREGLKVVSKAEDGGAGEETAQQKLQKQIDAATTSEEKATLTAKLQMLKGGQPLLKISQ